MKTTKKKKPKGKKLDFYSVDVRVGERIREIRKSKRMTQMDLAKLVGVRFQQVQKYETGFNRVSASRLYMIAQALEVEVADLFGDELIQRLESKV